MILPAVRERLEALLRHAAMEGALAALRSGANHISITGLHDVAKALAAALWRYQDPAAYLYLTRTLAKDTEIPHVELISHLGSVGYTRTEMVELPGQFAVRGGIVDVFSPEAARPVRIELLGDTVESVREFDPRTQRSIAPVVRTTFL